MFDHYQPTFSGLVMELGVYVLAVVLAVHAHSQRANWRCTLFLGMAAGLILEILLVKFADKSKVYYEYGTGQFFVSIANVPACVGIGWGIVLYASTWTAHRLNIPWFRRALVAGALAVNIDLSLDPVAHALGFWEWKGVKNAEILDYYGVPFDNYVAWFGIVALFSLSARGGFRVLDRWFPRDQQAGLRSWTNAIVPALALVFSGGVFWLVRENIDWIYQRLDVSGGGQAKLFLFLFVLTAYYLWSHNIASRRDMAIHWAVLAVPIFFHVTCMVLLLYKGIDTQPTLLVLIPMTAVVGFFSYIWPSIDTFLGHGNARMRDRQRRALLSLLQGLTPEQLAQQQRELHDPRVSPVKKRGLVAHQIGALLHTLYDRGAGAHFAAADLHELYQCQVEAIARELDGAGPALAAGAGRGGRLEMLADALIAAADRAGQDVVVERRRLLSYGGHRKDATVYRPRTRAALGRLLARFEQEGRCVTFRAGGNAFDDQSLNDVVISLDHFNEIRVDPAAARVTVGAAATWGDILKATLKHDLIPYVMVTSRATTAGGTLSADSLSRFSPSCGKEGLFVVSFVLMKLDGTLARCSRTENRDLFRAAIAGLGYVGAVLEITYELLRVRDGAKLAVHTDFWTCELEEVAEQLVKGLAGIQRCVGREENCLVCTPKEPLRRLEALSAVIYLRGPGKGLVAKSRYVEAEKSEWKRSPFHHPYSVRHLLLQLGAHIPGVRALAYWYIFSRVFKKPDWFVDELFGYTFFEDGNHLLRSWGRKLGLRMGIRQQTFVVRWDPADIARSKANLKRFLDAGEALLKARGLRPALIDVLYVPDDGIDDFLLTSNYDLAGFAVTYTFEKLVSTEFGKEEAFFRELSQIVAKEPFHGRVHLVKNVHADATLLEQMYGPRLLEMAAIRQREGVTDVLQNEFLRRVLPSLRWPPPSISIPSSAPPPSSRDGSGDVVLLPPHAGGPEPSVVVADGAGK